MVGSHFDRPRRPAPGRTKRRLADGVGDHQPRPPAQRLVIGRAADKAETDADRLASDVLGGLEAKQVRRRAAGHDELGGTEVPAEITSKIRQATGGGRVDNSVRRAVEEQSGRDLSGVRVHRGEQADELNRSLQATAFTVGNDVFVSNAAAPSGTAEGDHLMAHELAHVVQQGGEARRVQRLFGSSSGKKVKGASGGEETTNGLSQADKAEQRQMKEQEKTTRKTLQGDLKVWESALRKLEANAADEASWPVATQIRDSAKKLLASLPGATGTVSKRTGVQFPDEVQRIQQVIADCGAILKHQTAHRVAASNRAAEEQSKLDMERLPEAKKQASDIYTGDAASGGLKNLTGGAQIMAFGGATDNDDAAAIRDRIAAAGNRLGLSSAETSAIATFTLQDYLYINPATANVDSWMKNQNATAVAKDELSMGIGGHREKARAAEGLKGLKEEGSLHAAFAVSGLQKLPVWAGPSYRGEVLTNAEFAKKFTAVQRRGGSGRVIAAKTKTMNRATIASNSKDRGVSEMFTQISMGERGLQPDDANFILWIMDMTNGRDIEELSGNAHEKEVATLPGAQFTVTKVTEERGQSFPGINFVVVHAKQTK